MSKQRMSQRATMFINDEQIEMLKVFNSIDDDGNGSISVKELGQALEVVGIKLPGYQVRELVDANDKNHNDSIDVEEFKEMYTKLRQKYDVKGKLFNAIKPVEGIKEVGPKSPDPVASGAKHSVRVEEYVAFSNWININFADDVDCASYLPLNPDSDDLYSRIQDGILLCKMINFAQAETIHEQAINKTKPLNIYKCHENLTLALRSAQSIGCNIVNIGPEDLHEGKEHLVLGLIWQIIRIGLLAAISLTAHKELVVLLLDGETLEDLMRLSPEEILIRWVNYHLRKSGCGRQISNFSSDIKDSIAYIHLLHQISPAEAGVDTSPERVRGLPERAEKMLQQADKIKCRVFVSPQDVVKGNSKLNLAFVATLFNKYPALELVDAEVIEETREEKTYRNWMNSLGVSPRVNHLYFDLRDGLAIFQLYDIINPGCVDWKRVVEHFNAMQGKSVMEKIGNCNYVVELGKQCKFSLVGIDGKNIYDGDRTLTLAVVWQLMRAYTISLLNQLRGQVGADNSVDKEIVSWANAKLKSEGKESHISGFSDPSISTGKVVIDLVDAIRPKSINYSVVKPGDTDEEKLNNAKYGISVARSRGARIYALPEDIVEVKNKMVMTVFACLMILDLQPAESAD